MKNNGTLAVFMLLCTLFPTRAAGIEPNPDNNKSDWLYEIRAGILAHDVDNLWSGSKKEDGIDLNAEIIFGHPSFSLFSGTMRPSFGLSVNTHGDTSKLYSGLLWEYMTKSSIFLNLGVGVAVHNGELEDSGKEKKQLGSRVLFRIPIEVGYALNQHHRLSIMFDHISNAYLAHPNEGLDTLGLRYGYRF